MNDLLDEGVFEELEPTSRVVLAALEDSATVTDVVMQVAIAVDIEDAVVAEEVADGLATHDLIDPAVAEDEALPRVRSFVHLQDDFDASSLLDGVRRATADLADEGVAGDELDPPALFADVIDTAYTGEVADSRRATSADVIDAAVAADVIDQRLGSDLLDGCAAEDSVVVHVRHRADITDSAYAGEEIDQLASLQGDLLDAAVAVDEVTLRVVHRPTIEDMGFLEDELESMGDHAWTASLRDFAMSRYEGYPYESVVAGMAAGPGGVYLPGDGAVPWAIKTGKLDFNIPTRKRLSHIYALGSHPAPLTIEVGGDVHGQWLDTAYEQMARDASADRVIRCQVGRGYCSNLFTVRVSGEEMFILHSAEALMQISKRRI